MRRWWVLGLALALLGVGLWVSIGLSTIQIWLFGAGLVGLVGIASEGFVGQPPGAESSGQEQALQGFAVWIAPSLLTAASLWIVRTMPPDSQMTAIAAAVAAMGILLLGLRAGVEPRGRFSRPGRFASNLVLYLLVFILFALIYHTRERSLFTATSAGLVAFLAALELIRSSQGGGMSGWPVAALVGLVAMETTWALNYWPVSGMVGGALLLLTFYVFGGLLLATREGSLDRRLLVEYGTVGVAGLFALGWAMF